MTMKLYSLARWTRLQPGSSVVFDGMEGHERRVRVDVNAEAETRLYIELADGEVQFLCTVPAGIETIEFNTEGTFCIFPAEGSGEIFYQSADLEPTHIEVVDPEIFTTIAERRHRNPEIEEIMYRSQMNLERRLAQQRDEYEAMMERRIKEMSYVDAGTVAETGRTEVSGEVTGGEGESATTDEPSEGDRASSG